MAPSSSWWQARWWQWAGLRPKHDEKEHTQDDHGYCEEQPSQNQRSVLSQLLRPSSTRSRAQSSSSRVVIERRDEANHVGVRTAVDDDQLVRRHASRRG